MDFSFRRRTQQKIFRFRKDCHSPLPFGMFSAALTAVWLLCEADDLNLWSIRKDIAVESAAALLKKRTLENQDFLWYSDVYIMEIIGKLLDSYEKQGDIK